MNKFKVGDKVFSTFLGFGKVGKFSDRYLVFISDVSYIEQYRYYLDGRYGSHDKHPSLFHSAKEAAEYFGAIKEKKKFSKKIALLNSGTIYSFLSDADDSEIMLSTTGWGSKALEIRLVEWESEE